MTTAYTNRDLLRWLLTRAKPQWRAALIAGLAMVMTAALEPILPALMQPLVDKTLINRNPTSLWQVPLFIVLAFSAKGLADYMASVASQHLAQHTVAALRSELFAHELELSVALHQDQGTGPMISKITYDTNMVADTLSSAWLVIVRDTLILIGLAGFLFYTAWQLALLVVVIAPIVAIVIRRASGSLRTSNTQLQLWTGRATGLINESLIGLREIKIFNYQPFRVAKFNHASQMLRDEQMRIVRTQAINVPVVQVIAAFAVALVIFVASLLNSRELLTPGEFVAFITAVAMIFEPVRRLTNINPVIQRGLAACQSIRSLLEAPSEEELGVLPLGSRVGPDGSSLVSAGSGSRAQGHIRFEKVWFAYPGRPEPVLRDFDLHIPAGSSLAVVGESGAGKSTILHLIARFVTPQKGVVLLDGGNVSELSLSSLRNNIGFVSQNVLLFDGSIFDNIRMGNPSATREQVVRAAEAANAAEFIDRLPQGLDTALGDLGQGLSGGQRQRIAIARAILRDAPILLLDEATSALDRGSEASVLQAIERLMAGRTTIFVTHAPERLPRVDRTLKLPQH